MKRVAKPHTLGFTRVCVCTYQVPARSLELFLYVKLQSYRLYTSQVVLSSMERRFVFGRVLCVVATLLLVSHDCNARICFGDVCIQCPSGCSGIESPSMINSATVEELRQGCSCICVPMRSDTSCEAVSKSTGETIPDDQVVSSSGIVPSPQTSSGTTSGITYQCASSCMVTTFNPVISGDVTVEDITTRGCTCASCSGSNKCIIKRDGVTLAPTDVLTVDDVLSARGVSSGKLASWTVAVAVTTLGVALQMAFV